ncbi:unnamed protein product (mitochondrion) [Plasmodiophora brassicae]|uniref:NAD(P) transhydrogenase, mitochondrial n=1 Tax=Plasmodiophora brassicae TaxID=37360 RepID=A0A3P3YAB8_PLABS|nr:unnamed protein product [Plasmodiophora brassicae]
MLAARCLLRRHRRVRSLVAPSLLPVLARGRHCVPVRFQSSKAPAAAEARAGLPAAGRPHGIPYANLTIGVPKEVADGEARVAQTPDTCAALVRKGFRVVVQSGAGAASNFSDADYAAAGATIVPTAADAFNADIVLKVRPPMSLFPPDQDGFHAAGVVLHELDMMRRGATLISFLQPAVHTDTVDKARSSGVNALAMDCIPRITRAQAMDALSSMSNIAGVRAVIEAANAYGRFWSKQITAAGTTPPAKVLVLGGGVAGLAAAAQAKNLGAIVRVFDVREAVAEQAQSIGAEFLRVPGFEGAEGAGGYAKEMSEEFLEAERTLFADQLREVDIVITTALIPGRPAPRLITDDMVALMRPGSVIVDLAAEAGGNVATTVPGRAVKVANDVTCIGYTDLVSRMATQASSMFARNQLTFLLGALRSSHGDEFLIDVDDVVARCALVTLNGDLMWPAPALPSPSPPKPQPSSAKVAPVSSSPASESFRTNLRRSLLLSSGVLGLLGLGGVGAGAAFTGMATTLALSAIVGNQTVWNVAPSLHSPLMSVTNAISGTTAIGGLLCMGGGYAPDTLSQACAALAVLLSSVNIAGGFLVSHRMLAMFRRPGDPPDYAYLYALPAAAFGGAYLSGVQIADVHAMGFLTSSLLCIASLSCLSSQSTARVGNTLGMLGVGAGLATTVGALHADLPLLVQIGSVVAAGGSLGAYISGRVSPVQLPQTVAAFHSLVGAAAMLTSASAYSAMTTIDAVHAAALFSGMFIGGMTLTGSIVAFAKLQGLISSKPVTLPGRDLINVGLSAASVAALVPFMADPASPAGAAALAASALLSTSLGAHVTSSIGGADMPVAITVLNSYSGWALCAEGFMLQNDLLTIVGSLIGSSGAILSYVMCRSMNRNLATVLFGGIGAERPAQGASADVRPYQETSASAVADALLNARKVVVVPGYGLCVAGAQYSLAQMIKALRDRDVDVKFAIHPVAGRMPGQLNVILAEAGVPHDIVHELEAINDEFKETCVTLVIGANDTINRSAEDDPNSPIKGMPVLRVWDSKNVIILKRSMGAGYLDIDNPVFYDEKTQMLLADAKASCDELYGHISNRAGASKP